MQLNHIADLNWYFGYVSWSSSSQGLALDRARTYHIPRATKAKELTAQPRKKTHSTEPSHVEGTSISESQILRYGSISRKLNKLTPDERQTLAVAYGDYGARYALTPLGRAAAIFPLIPSGQALLTWEQSQFTGTTRVPSYREALELSIALHSTPSTHSVSKRNIRQRLITTAALEALYYLKQAQDKYETIT